MQTLILVYSKSKRTTSLRDQVINDAQLDQFGLNVVERQKQGRSQGWAKLKMKDSHGAVNLQWNAPSKTLICRIVTKGGKPHDIAGAFVTFLLARLPKQIASIHVLPG